MIQDRVDETLELYFQQCSVLVNCRDLALMGATLANSGMNPTTGTRALQAQFEKDVLSIMLSCGMYDYAGEWAFRTGLPAKSGVGEGVLAVVPGVAGIAVFSPPWDSKGNSVRGVLVCRELSEKHGLHIFESGFAVADALRSCGSAWRTSGRTSSGAMRWPGPWRRLPASCSAFNLFTGGCAVS